MKTSSASTWRPAGKQDWQLHRPETTIAQLHSPSQRRREVSADQLANHRRNLSMDRPIGRYRHSKRGTSIILHPQHYYLLYGCLRLRTVQKSDELGFMVRDLGSARVSRFGLELVVTTTRLAVTSNHSNGSDSPHRRHALIIQSYSPVSAHMYLQLMLFTNGISIGSAVFAGIAVVSNTHIDTQTRHVATYRPRIIRY